MLSSTVSFKRLHSFFGDKICTPSLSLSLSLCESQGVVVCHDEFGGFYISPCSALLSLAGGEGTGSHIPQEGSETLAWLALNNDINEYL